MTTPEHSHSSESGRCVLIVDDNEGVRKMLSLVLEAAGFDVATAGTAQQAQLHLAQTPPDALVLNLQRSEADGLDMLRSIRARADLSNVPIVFLACCDNEDIRWHALRAGADWFGLRPLAMAELKKRIHQLIHGGRPPLNLLAARTRPGNHGSRQLMPTG